MSTHKSIDLICVVVLVCTLLLTGLFMKGESFGLAPLVDGDAESSTDSGFFTRNDRDGGWDSAGATRITLLGDRAGVSGGGAYVYDGNVVIVRAGRYVVSGALNDGSIVIDADSRDKVWLMLDGAEIHCSDDACLRVEQADKVFLTLAENSVNSMQSGAEYSEEALADNTGGVIFSCDDLTINGSGSLSITAAFKHGIDVNDELVVTGGAIRIDAPRDAVHVNDGLRIENAALTLRAGDEGLTLEGEEALLYVASGRVAIESTGASIRSAGEILIEGGRFELKSEADGIHGMGSVAITGGTLSINAADDGIHADHTVTVSGGNIRIPACYEGIEALYIDILDGEIEIRPTDDGLNANGGSGGFGPPGMFRKQTGADGDADEEEPWIHISGGSLSVVNSTARDADGIDSNGDILISGGNVRISLTASGTNSAIDFGSEGGGVLEISGGEVVACGSGMMTENFSDTSSQCSILYNPGYTAPANSSVSLRDADGEVLLSYTAPCSFSSVAFSSPELKLGETYTVIIGDGEEEITLETVNTTNSADGGFGLGPGQMGRGGAPAGRRPGAAGENASDRPAPPDFDGKMPQNPGDMAPPDFDGELPPFFGGDRQRNGQKSPTEATADSQPEAGTAGQAEPSAADGSTVSGSTWLKIGASFLVLTAGILFAVKVKG